MPTHTRTQPDGTWVDGYVPPPADWEDLERKIFGSWNGVRGGAYCHPNSLSDQWFMGGAGFNVTGPTRLTYGGALRGAAGTFVIRDGAWPQLAIGHAGRTRSIVQPLAVFATKRRYLWTRNHPYCGVGSVALACKPTNGRVVETSDLYLPLRVVDGATVLSVKLHFRVASRRTFAPIAMPKLRIMRVAHDSSGTNLPVPLRETADGLGYDFLPLATTPDAWYADGAAQTFEYVCDQNNVVDTSLYSYVAHLVEEVGAVSPDDDFDGVRYVERKNDVYAVTPNSVSLTGSLTVDGASMANGGRYLCVDTDAQIKLGEPDASGQSARNGIWLGNTGGAWTRATDADDQQDFSPNWIVKATSGDINSSAAWQCQHPSTRTNLAITTSGVTTSLSATQPRIVPAEPRGNIYHAVTTVLDVPDLRFQ